MLRRLDPETAHGLTLKALAAGLAPKAADGDEPILASRLWNLEFANPVGLSAGFDKDAAVIVPMLGLGFGFVEVGSITPQPQPGNPRPRVFRLAEEGAVINRLGFNSGGLEQARARLQAYRDTAGPRPVRGLVGVNLGKNRDSADAAADYAEGAAALGPLADYLVVNVSSPNTPGLRALQGRGELEDLLGRVRAALPDGASGAAPPLLLKIAPDLTEEDKRDIAAVCLAQGVSGIIATNTTIARPPGLKGAARAESGGLSGKPLFGPSTAVLSDLYRLTEGKLPLIGVGGVASGADAYRKIRAGASLVQLYTALIYRGPGLVARIKRELAGLLREDGFASLAEAVGADHRYSG